MLNDGVRCLIIVDDHCFQEMIAVGKCANSREVEGLASADFPAANKAPTKLLPRATYLDDLGSSRARASCIHQTNHIRALDYFQCFLCNRFQPWYLVVCLDGASSNHWLMVTLSKLFFQFVFFEFVLGTWQNVAVYLLLLLLCWICKHCKSDQKCQLKWIAKTQQVDSCLDDFKWKYVVFSV